MYLFTTVFIFAIFRSVSAAHLTYTNYTLILGLPTHFYFLSWINDSCLPIEVTVQFRISDLTGSAVVTLIASSTPTSRRPYKITNSIIRVKDSAYNSTATSTGFTKPT